MAGELQCSQCEKAFSSDAALIQHNQAKHGLMAAASHSRKSSRLFSFILIAVLFIAAISYMIYATSAKPAPFDDFAQCLTATGAVVYGNDFCQYTTKELNWFGSSAQHLSYVKCAENKDLCQSKGVKVTPTWEIKGQMYPEVQTFQRLSDLTGCKLPA